MEWMTDMIYTYEQMAEMIAERILNRSCKLVGMTGTSCVGKSTFSGMINEHLKKADYTTQIMKADDYLYRQHRGVTSYWNREESSYLKAEYYNWELLKKDIGILHGGNSVTGGCYTRGIGWEASRTMYPADCLFVEGLFLDSVQAAEYVEFDLLIALTAEDELIRKLRMNRDDYYRQNYKNFSRTKSETLKEIEDTLMAGKSYQVCCGKENYFRIQVLENYRMKCNMPES